MERGAGATVARLSRVRPQARGLATRRRVLSAAEHLFTRRGFDQTSMADVAARAGVGVGTLYHHFADKRALLLALIDDWSERELAKGRGALDFERFFARGARHSLAEDLGRRYRELRDAGGLYLVLLELAERDADVRARVNVIEQVAIERTRDLIVFGQRRGEIRAALDPVAAAFLVRNTIRIAATELLVHRVAEPAPERVVEGLVDMIAHYLLEDPNR